MFEGVYDMSLFITFEGGEGSGKTTIAKMLHKQFIVEKVLPVLKEDGIVICDRFIDSSLVYQGIGRGIGVDNIYNMNLFATDGILPDLTIFFDVKPEVALKRITGDRDLESLDFHHKVYEGYQMICDKFPDRIVKVDASLPVEEVYRQVYEIVKDRL